MSSQKPLSPIKQAWYRWKSLRWVPGRKKFLVGLDLHGNTFWEFRDTLSSHQHRMRRIVQYPGSTQYSDVNIPPQWHQWLRHTRADAPSLTEQSQDLVRQRNLKVLAAAADARWAAKPSFLDAPGETRGQPLPTLAPGDRETHQGNTMPGKEEDAGDTTREETGRVAKAEPPKQPEEPHEMQAPDGVRHRFDERPKQKGKEKDDPWKQVRGGPSEQWKPAQWDGRVAPAKRP
ncbi:NADH-ubiquinone oxidoreductase assembly factor N7BML [Lachnellula arida]|uniref:NADH-ubiquinone oxidoreductase assembly factor N7BML n=1 Tax=Lachnellula arida TaxID=1316785 RepID=A0A8T9BAL3_9HELO|nr:NADH-ubiquinone oxidoreductase assembly factor N7BML [Lachnellula arida]